MDLFHFPRKFHPLTFDRFTRKSKLSASITFKFTRSMFPSHFIAPSAHINAMDDEARPRINNKRGSSARQRDTKPRLLLPPRVAKRITSTKRSGIYKSILPGATITTITTDMNVASLMQEICPQDIIPKIFAFAGPQMAAVFHRTNTFWRDTFQDDATWRILCEELYKVRYWLRPVPLIHSSFSY